MRSLVDGADHATGFASDGWIQVGTGANGVAVRIEAVSGLKLTIYSYGTEVFTWHEEPTPENIAAAIWTARRFVPNMVDPRHLPEMDQVKK